MTTQAVARLDTGQAELEELVGEVLAQANRRGATQAEAAASVDVGLSVNVRLGEVETVEYQRDRGLGVTVYFGQRKGSASTADLSPDAVHQAVDKACSIATFTAEDKCAGLAEPEMMAERVPDLDLCHPWPITPAEAIELALACEDAARAVDPRITNSEGASVNTHHGLRVYGNSHDFIGGYPSTGHTLSCAVVASDGTEMERDYWYDSSRVPTDLAAPEAIGRLAGARSVRRLGARKIATCKTPVVFPPELARGFLGHFLGAIRGSAQYRGASFLLNAAGEQLFPEWLQINERPHLLRALGSAPVDSEGVATRDRDLIRDGVLQGYVLDTYSARKLGLTTTGNAGGVHNLLVSASGGGLETLIAQMGRGFLVGELMGHGVNPVTGDYSRGAAGFWIEDGVIAYPVHEITVAGNLRDLYRGIAALGDDVDTRGRIRCGSLLLEEMTVAGD